MSKIGFIGLGIMGKPMSKNLLRAGHELVVYDINVVAVEDVVTAGAKKGKSPKDIAEECPVIITMLPNSHHVKEVVMGKDGILEGIRAGAVYIDMSSIAPAISKEICAVLMKKGANMLDAPVSGGEPKAIDGSLSIMVGGEKQVFEKVKDVLLKMGATAILCGEIGAGNTTKLANQIIVAANIAALSEALVFSKKAGVEPEAVFNAIRSGLAGSTVMDSKAPMMFSGNFKPGFRIELHIKDLKNVIETAYEVGAPLPITSLTMEMMQWLKTNEMQTLDHSSIIQYYEALAGQKIN